jgi:2-methylaconitate cis-trans-isomerase PrpF
LAETIQEATQQSQAVPKIACVSAPKPYQTLGGKTVKIAEVDLVARMMSMGTLHKSFAVSGAVATAGAARIPGTVVHDLISLEASKKEIMRLGHPGGIIEVGAVVKETRGNFNYKEAILGRTARRLMEGNVLVPEKYFHRDSR